MNRSAFLRNVFTLISGKVASQIFSLAMVPIIARLYTPDDFGIAAIFVTITTLIAIAVPMRYFRASLLIEDEARSKMMLALSAWLLLAGCVLTFIFVLVFDSVFESLGSLALLLPIGVFLYGMGQFITTEHTRQQTFKRVAIADFGYTFTVGASRILLGAGGSSALSLIIGYLLACFARVALLTKASLNPLSLYKIRLPWSECKALMLEYKDFPLHNMPSGFVTSLAGKVPILILGALFAPAAVGIYAMADRLVRLPVVSVSTSIREVFVRKLTINSDDRGKQKLLIKLTLSMFLLGIIPFIVLGTLGPYVLVYLLGDEWAETGTYVQILAPWYFAVWVTTGLQPTLMTLRKQALWLRIQIFILFTRLSVFGVGYLMAEDIQTILIWFSAANVAVIILVLLIVFYQLKKNNASSTGGSSGKKTTTDN